MSSCSKKLVIVAEDEILTRMLAAEVLQDAGYEVEEASCADEALAVMKAQPGEVFLLFTDVHMPGSITGLELAHAVRNHWPKMAIIVTSGALALKPHDLPAGGIFVAKPYEMDAVLEHVGSFDSGPPER